MADIKQSCRTCKWLVPGEDKNGRRLVTKIQMYQCSWPAPEIALPDSITRAYAFKAPADAHRSPMLPDRGTNCPVWEQYAKDE